MIRILTAEIETDRPTDYDLINAMEFLAETVAAECDGAYRVSVTEGGPTGDVIFESYGSQL